MNNLMTEEGLEGSGSCSICFYKIENYDVLSDQDSQKIIKKCWKYLYKNIANNKTAKSSDENQLPLCKKCFDAASELMQLSEHVKNCEKQISDLSFEFSLGVLARRTQVEGVNNKSDDSPKEFVVLDVSKISPSLFSMDPPNPTKTEDFEHQCANSFVETDADAVLNVPQYRLEIVKQEFNEYYDDNSQTGMLECPEEETNLIENQLIKVEDIQDGVTTFSNMPRNYPASGYDMGAFFNNASSQIDDSPMSAGSDSSDANDTTQFAGYRKPVAMLTKVEESDVSDNFNSMSSPLNPSIKQMRSKSSKKNIRQPATPSNIIIGKTGSGNWKNVSISGLSHAHEGSDAGQRSYECYFCKKVLTRKEGLERHLRVHIKEKPFKCSVCEKTFSELRSANRHKKIHTGERPFKCSICAKAFTRSSHVKRHEKIHLKNHERIPSNEISHLNVRIAK